MAPKYYIAKYIADLQRYEPRNIGVIVWSPNGIVARFVGEEETDSGECRIDGRKIPKFVVDAPTFRAWIEFWRGEIGKESVRSLKTRENVSSRSADFMDAIAEKSRGEFLLTPAGFLLDEVAADGLNDLADYLFRLLVIPPRKLEENEPDEEGLNR